jgi:hypothetical protein
LKSLQFSGEPDYEDLAGIETDNQPLPANRDEKKVGGAHDPRGPAPRLSKQFKHRAEKRKVGYAVVIVSPNNIFRLCNNTYPLQF